MRCPPGPHSCHVGLAAEVIPVLRLAQPGALTRRLPRLPTRRLPAIPLPRAIARIRLEKLPAMPALARSPRMHRPCIEGGPFPFNLPLPAATASRGSRGEEKPLTEEDLFPPRRKNIDRRKGDFLFARNRRVPTRRSQTAAELPPERVASGIDRPLNSPSRKQAKSAAKAKTPAGNQPENTITFRPNPTVKRDRVATLRDRYLVLASGD